MNNPIESAELGRETVHAGRFLSLARIRWRGPDGRERVWESAERTSAREAVLIVPRLEPTGEYVLIRQYRPPARALVLEFPAGLVEPGEPPEVAALRELREETGFAGIIEAMTPAAFTSPGLSGETVYTARVVVNLDAPENRDARATPDDGEFIEILRVLPADAPALLAAETARGGRIDAKVIAFFAGFDIGRTAPGNPS